MNLLVATLSFLLGATMAGYAIHHPSLEISRPYGRAVMVIGLCMLMAHAVLSAFPLAAIGVASTLAYALLYLLLRPLAEHVLHTHARLQASELRLRQMFEGNPGPILVYDLDTLAILDANPAACIAFGWERDELLEQTIDQFGTLAELAVQLNERPR